MPDNREQLARFVNVALERMECDSWRRRITERFDAAGIRAHIARHLDGLQFSVTRKLGDDTHLNRAALWSQTLLQATERLARALVYEFEVPPSRAQAMALEVLDEAMREAAESRPDSLDSHIV